MIKGRLRDSTQAEWEQLAQLDPYWAVLSNDIYRRENLSETRFSEFLKSGENDVEETWRICRHLFGKDFAPARVLDFGCGVGRVTLPLARRVESVVAVDVADSMLALTRALLDKHDVRNVQVVKSDESLSLVQAPFDLVHSMLVLQHVPTPRGLWLTKRLLDLTADDGGVVLHLLYHNPRRRSLPVRIASRAIRPLRRFRGRAPEIQMNAYPLNDVFKIIQDAGARRIHVEFTNHIDHLGVTLFFKKN